MSAQTQSLTEQAPLALMHFGYALGAYWAVSAFSAFVWWLFPLLSSVTFEAFFFTMSMIGTIIIWAFDLDMGKNTSNDFLESFPKVLAHHANRDHEQHLLVRAHIAANGTLLETPSIVGIENDFFIVSRTFFMVAGIVAIAFLVGCCCSRR